MDSNDSLRYPIGKANEQRYATAPFNEDLKNELLPEIKILPSALEMAVLNLDKDHLDTPYRPGGWTVTQLVHHIADSHMNAYTRCKLALTENNPTIKSYDQDLWANLPDKDLPINISTTLLHALHSRWYEILVNLTTDDWNKTFYHPETKKTVTIWEVLKTYAWHGKHHVAHILQLRERNNW